MSTPIAKDSFSFSLGDLTYIDSSFNEDSVGPFAEAHRHRLAAWFARQLHRVSEWQHRRAVMQEIAMMSDRELSDIGLSRSDIAHIFDPTFASNHARDRDYIAY